MTDILCARSNCKNHARETVYFDVTDERRIAIDACAQHVDSLRKYIPGFNVVESGMCVIVGCKDRRKSKGCCENHYQHVKQWKLTKVALEFVEYDIEPAPTKVECVEYSGVGVMGTAIGVADTDPPPPAIIEEPQGEVSVSSNCPDVAEASPVDVECDDGNPLIEAWRKAKLMPVEVIDERVAEIVRLEQENTALRERLAKEEKQTSVFVLDESDLRRRYHNMILGEQTIRELDGGAYVTVKLNNVDIHIDEFEVDRIKRRLRERAEKQISDALRMEVTVTPKDALFYLVWSPDGRTPPRYRHYSLEEAKKAANQMKSIHGGEFYAVAVLGDVSDNKDDIPF